MKRNWLYKYLTMLMKNQPETISTPVWLITKIIISDIRECCVDKFLTNNEITIIEKYINLQLDQIAELTDIKEIYTVHYHICDLIDFCIKKSVELELYEVSNNFKLLSNLLGVKITFEQN